VAYPVPADSECALDFFWRISFSANRYPLRRDMREGDDAMHRRRFIASAFAAGAGLVAPIARAANFPDPSRTIRLIVPFAAGGGVRVVARPSSGAAQGQRGLTVIVENRGGASGTIGGEFVHKAAPDGYTLLFSASTHTTARLVMREVPYDPLTDFVPIARVGEAPMLVIMSKDRPQTSIAEV